MSQSLTFDSALKAFLGQMAPNTGEDENGVVIDHPGFNATGPILEAFPSADFTTDGYKVMTITNIGEKVTGETMTSGAFSSASSAKIVAAISSAMLVLAL